MLNLDRETIRPRLTVPLVLGALIFAVYYPALSGGFVWSEEAWALGQTPGYLPYYEDGFSRPAFGLLQAALSQAFGCTPAGYHYAGLVLHGANAWLVYSLGAYLLGSAWAGGMAACLFALHPLGAEPVAWISALPWPLFTAFYLSSLLFFLRYFDSGKFDSLVCGTLLLVLSLLSSQSAMTFPLVVLALGVRHGGVGGLGRGRIVRGFAASLAAVALTLVVSRGPGEFFPPGGIGLSRFADAFGSFGYYLEKLVLPVGHSIYLMPPEGERYFLFAFVPFAGIALLYSSGARRELSLVLFFLLAALPALWLTLSGVNPSVGERFMYLPIAAFSIFAAHGLARIPRRAIAACILVPVLVALGAGTYLRAKVWGGGAESVWAEAGARYPGAAMVRINHAVALLNAGRGAEGIKELEGSFQTPDISFKTAAPLVARIHGEGLALDDTVLVDALQRYRTKEEAYYFLGIVYYHASALSGKPGLLGKSAAFLTRAADLKDDYVDARFYLGMVLARLGDLDGSLTRLGEALRLDTLNYYKADIERILPLIKRGIAERDRRAGHDG